jgi:hypothetical protein
MNLDYTRGLDKRYGRAAALHDLAYRAVNRVTPFDVLDGVVLTTASLDPSYLDATTSGQGWDFLGRDELLMPGRLEGTEMTASFVEDALARGDRCFAKTVANTIASYGWYSTRPTDIGDGLTLHFDPAYAYMYSGFTASAYRGQRLHGIGMAGAMTALGREGKRGLVSYVNSNNFASQRSCARMGYVRFGSIVLLTVGSRRMGFETPGCRAFQFRAEPRRGRTGGAGANLPAFVEPLAR